jgi:hypothetical protein
MWDALTLVVTFLNVFFSELFPMSYTAVVYAPLKFTLSKTLPTSASLAGRPRRSDWPCHSASLPGAFDRPFSSCRRAVGNVLGMALGAGRTGDSDALDGHVGCAGSCGLSRAFLVCGLSGTADSKHFCAEARGLLLWSGTTISTLRRSWPRLAYERLLRRLGLFR